MEILFSSHFIRAYHRAPERIQRAFDKHLTFLEENIRHPSLRAKKYDEAQNVWQARVTRDWRFYFRIQGDTYLLLNIMVHPK